MKALSARFSSLPSAETCVPAGPKAFSPILVTPAASRSALSVATRRTSPPNRSVSPSVRSVPPSRSGKPVICAVARTRLARLPRNTSWLPVAVASTVKPRSQPVARPCSVRSPVSESAASRLSQLRSPPRESARARMSTLSDTFALRPSAPRAATSTAEDSMKSVSTTARPAPNDRRVMPAKMRAPSSIERSSASCALPVRSASESHTASRLTRPLSSAVGACSRSNSTHGFTRVSVARPVTS